MIPRASERRVCRVCGRTNLFRYLDLGMQPLANAFREFDAPLSDEFRVPLVLQACPQCKLSQLTHVVPKELLYTTYAYSSGVNRAWHTHCEGLAQRFARPGAFVIDIASNDGTLLSKFAALGCETLGVEPSTSFPATATYNKVTQWWTRSAVERLSLIGIADVITAQNVLGHVDDVHDFMAGIASALKPTGVAVVEVPHLVKLLSNGVFDTVYHEHLSYWTVTALSALCDAHGLVVQDVQHLDVHGGSIRVVIGKEKRITRAVETVLVDEAHLLRKPTYLTFSTRATRTMATINEELQGAAPYYGLGAAAKTTVLLNTLDVRALPCAVFDSTPVKQHLRVPGTQVPVLPEPHDWSKVDGPVAIFCWNWWQSALAKMQAAGYRGQVFVPLPKPRWITVA